MGRIRPADGTADKHHPIGGHKRALARLKRIPVPIWEEQMGFRPSFDYSGRPRAEWEIRMRRLEKWGLGRGEKAY